MQELDRFTHIARVWSFADANQYLGFQTASHICKEHIVDFSVFSFVPDCPKLPSDFLDTNVELYVHGTAKIGITTEVNPAAFLAAIPR